MARRKEKKICKQYDRSALPDDAKNRIPSHTRAPIVENLLKSTTRPTTLHEISLECKGEGWRIFNSRRGSTSAGCCPFAAFSPPSGQDGVQQVRILMSRPDTNTPSLGVGFFSPAMIVITETNYEPMRIHAVHRQHPPSINFCSIKHRRLTRSLKMRGRL